MADTGNRRILGIDASGTVSNLAGAGWRGLAGEEGPAILANLDTPTGVAADAAGNVYLADSMRSYPGSSGRIYKIDASGAISTVAVGGSRDGDGIPATEAYLGSPTGVAANAAGNVYVADSSRYRVFKINASGAITTVAGTGLFGHGGDGSPATGARLSPAGVAVDATGNVYVADSHNHRVRKVDATGTVTTVAGDGNEVDEWDGGLAAQARFQAPSSIALDGAGTLFFLDRQRVWKLDSSGLVTRVAGGGSRYSYDGGIPANEAGFPARVVGVAADAAGNLYVATSSGAVFKIDPAGTLNILAGVGSASAIAADAVGNVYVAAERPALVLKISPDGTVTTLAGGGEDRSEGATATEADLGSNHVRLAVDPAGHAVYVSVNVGRSYQVRKIDTATHTISTIGPPLGPYVRALAVDGAGRVYVGWENRIRRIDPDGSVWVIAGTGQEGFNGDGDLAGAAELSVSSMAVDRFGTVWFADPFNRRIRALDPVR